MQEVQYALSEVWQVLQVDEQYTQVDPLTAKPLQLLTQVEPKRYSPEVQEMQAVEPGPLQVRQGDVQRIHMLL